MTLAKQLATLLEQGWDQPRHRVDAAEELRRLRAEVDQLCAELTALREQPAVAQPLTDKQIDAILSTAIPGGSCARDWFLPHETDRGLANIREVVRLMVERAYGIGQPAGDAAKPGA